MQKGWMDRAVVRRNLLSGTDDTSCPCAADASRHQRRAVFEIDSFGGMANGGLRGGGSNPCFVKGQMPTVAILTDYAYSAGYLLASQARQIIIPEFGGTGSDRRGDDARGLFPRNSTSWKAWP